MRIGQLALFFGALLGIVAPCFSVTWQDLVAQSDSAMSDLRYEDSQSLLKQALEMAEAENGVDDQSVATILIDVGLCYYYRGMYADTEAAWKRALDIRERKYSSGALEIGLCVGNLAVLYKNTGRYVEAEALFRKAIDIREKMLGQEHPDLAAALNNLANLLLLAARYAEAEPLYQQALYIMEAAKGQDDPMVASALNNLAALYHVQGRYQDAEPLYLRALETNRAAYGEDHPDVIQSVKNLAELYHDRGEYAKAEPLYGQALEIGERVMGQDHPRVAATLSELARLYSDQGRYVDAEPLVRRAIKIGESSVKADNIEVAGYRKTLGDVLQLQGRLDDALAAYDAAFSNIEKSAGKEHNVAAEILHGKAMLAFARQNIDQAIELQKQAYVIRRKNFSEGFGVLAERSALDYSKFLQAEASNYLSFLLAAPNGENTYREEIARVVFSTKGLVTDGIFVRHKSVSAIAALVDSLNQARTELSKLYVEGPDPARSWAYQMDVSRATERKEKFEQALARSGTEFRGENIITQVAVQQVSADLPDGTSLVEFMRYERSTDLTGGEARYLAVVVKSNGRAFAADLGSVAEIDSAITEYRRHMADVRSLNIEEYRAVSSKLYRLIWQPFESQLTGLSAVFLSPDDALCLVSFGGLNAPDGQYLIEKYPIHYISSGRDLVRAPVTTATGKGLLAMGDPDYDASVAARTGKTLSGTIASAISSFMPSLSRGNTSGCMTLRDMQLGPLPETRSEVNSVVERWHASTTEPTQEFLGPLATEDAFKLHCSGARVLHLATHGYYISGSCTPETAGPGFVGESPLLQSGLFFAGANLKGSGAAEAGLQDGILTAEEVAAMNLAGVNLVVLSACETGLGEVRKGEGVFGLRRAFQMAGARTVISALWPVDDKSTADLMGNLFASGDEDLYAAMRNSVLRTLKSRRAKGESDHPFFWGAFIATGGWKRN